MKITGALFLLSTGAAESFLVLPVAPSFRVCHRVGLLHLVGVPDIWVEDAEDGFVDSQENLEEGETCRLSLKAFASDPDDEEGERLLCAGALVQRPASSVSDAWTADAILSKGGPNLQLNGAVKLLDEMFLFHLKNDPNNPGALKNFVLKCGSSTSEFSCASHMAGQLRGFRPLRDMVRVNSIYTVEHYEEDSDMEGMVFDYQLGKRSYEQVALTSDWEMAAEIWSLLPDPDLVESYTVVKEQEQDF
jgi:hypothetical protein